MTDDYSKFLIKDYALWSIYINENQSYLGRCIVWCKREKALDLTEATSEEQKELFVILDDLKNAVTKAFSPDWFNYSFLGNEMRHLHGHFIPRYAKAREFLGVIFEDKLWGHNYKTDHNFKISESILTAIQTKIKSLL
jgi:diadenosine tetraphosphate (Ap4A) HIT family hydrolase